MRYESKTKIVGDGTVDVVKKAQPVVESALLQMLTRSVRLRPFTVLTDVATGKFVQWCGSSSERLLFDVPAAGIVGEPTTDVAGSVCRGLELLRQLAIVSDGGGVPFSEGLVLEEADSHDAEHAQHTEALPGGTAA